MQTVLVVIFSSEEAPATPDLVPIRHPISISSLSLLSPPHLPHRTQIWVSAHRHFPHHRPRAERSIAAAAATAARSIAIAAAAPCFPLLPLLPLLLPRREPRKEQRQQGQKGEARSGSSSGDGSRSSGNGSGSGDGFFSSGPVVGEMVSSCFPLFCIRISPEKLSLYPIDLAVSKIRERWLQICERVGILKFSLLEADSSLDAFMKIFPIRQWTTLLCGDLGSCICFEIMHIYVDAAVHIKKAGKRLLLSNSGCCLLMGILTTRGNSCLEASMGQSVEIVSRF
ncbi:hypothetical protein L1049_026282 [Liquidambar formosana]|uniref:Uncharacterized protein n=1 Tax=Liquidambar formosana TaxID=63359 RepID=A0AAP0NCY3_LIQFO